MTAEDQVKTHRAVAEFEFAIMGEREAVAAQEEAKQRLAAARERVRVKGLALGELIPQGRGLVVNDHCYVHQPFHDVPIACFYVGP